MAIKSGLPKNAELALKDLLGSAAGRELFAHILRELDFMEVVADINGLIAQGVGKDLFDAAAIITKGDALQVIKEHFLEGGVQHGSSSKRDGDDDGNDGDGDGEFDLDD